MNVLKILQWIIEEGIDTEYLSIADVPKERDRHTDDFATFVKDCFDGIAIGDLRAGKYVYFYLDQVQPQQIASLAKKKVTPDTLVLTDESVIFLYMVEYDLEP